MLNTLFYQATDLSVMSQPETFPWIVAMTTPGLSPNYMLTRVIVFFYDSDANYLLHFQLNQALDSSVALRTWQVSHDCKHLDSIIIRDCSVFWHQQKLFSCLVIKTHFFLSQHTYEASAIFYSNHKCLNDVQYLNAKWVLKNKHIPVQKVLYIIIKYICYTMYN